MKRYSTLRNQTEPTPPKPRYRRIPTGYAVAQVVVISLLTNLVFGVVNRALDYSNPFDGAADKSDAAVTLLSKSAPAVQPGFTPGDCLTYKSEPTVTEKWERVPAKVVYFRVEAVGTMRYLLRWAESKKLITDPADGRDISYVDSRFEKIACPADLAAIPLGQ